MPKKFSTEDKQNILADLIDDIGPEKIICVSDRKTGMRGVLVIDNTARGPGKGGCRMAPDISVKEVCRLARTMTWKWAAANIYLGGAKAGIAADPYAPNKEAIVRSFVRALKEHIPKHYVFGLDMGLDEKDAAIVIDELGDRATSVGLPSDLGGIPYDELGATGFGVAECAEIVAEFSEQKLEGLTVSIQGFGAVGKAAAKFLGQKEATIIAISTVEGALVNSDGLDIGKLLHLQEEVGDEVVRKYDQGELLPLGTELTADVDILIPAAKQDVITAENVDDVKASMIIQGANMPITPEAERILHERGIIMLPDFIANAGAIMAAAIAMDNRYSCRPQNFQEVYNYIETNIKENAKKILEKAAQEKKLEREAAMEIARGRVKRAMQLKKGGNNDRSDQ